MVRDWLIRQVSDLLDGRHAHRVLVGCALLFLLLFGGYAADCEGFGEGWPGSATRGLLQLGSFYRTAHWPGTFRNDEDLFIRYDVKTFACGRESSQPQWFRIRLSRLFGASAPLSASDFEMERGELPPAIRATLREVHLGPSAKEPWPPNLTAEFGDCIARSWGDSTMVSDCGGKRVDAKLPAFNKGSWTDKAWWRRPLQIAGLPFAMLFDAITIPLNAAVVAIFLLPVYFAELEPKRRYFWRCGLAIAAAYDIMALLLFLRLSRHGHIGGGGLGAMLGGFTSVVGAAIFGAIIPLVAGAVVSKETERPAFQALGMLGALVCPFVLSVLVIVAEDLVDDAEDLPGVIAWLLNPIALVPGLFALVLVLRGRQWAKHLVGSAQ